MQQWHTNWPSLNQQPHLQNKILVSSVHILNTLFISHNIQHQNFTNTDILQYLCIKCILLVRPVELYCHKAIPKCDLKFFKSLCCHLSNTAVVFYKDLLPTNENKVRKFNEWSHIMYCLEIRMWEQLLFTLYLT
jgi:hypothetical protein